MKRMMVGGAIVVILTHSVFSQNTLPKDAEGWTAFTPSEDSRIIYVAQSGADDATADVYAAGDEAVGSNPFVPAGEVMPFKTVEAAFDQARNGYPDWILFKRGEEWTSGISPKDGRSADEPSLVGSYGADGSAPMFKTTQGIRRCCKKFIPSARVGSCPKPETPIGE